MQRMTTRPTLSITGRPGLDQFHFVWAEGRRAPRQRHTSAAEAAAEAERLSQINPDVKYHVYVARLVSIRKVTP
jgi:molybdopterin/thiamine biosynthesis adenylyltransferase